jgi:hypothetical protein
VIMSYPKFPNPRSNNPSASLLPKSRNPSYPTSERR